jgi:hypothetical protein
MGTLTTILILVLYGLMLAGGIYLKSYFNKKGENLATKEDFRDLKAQTAELRQVTKEIEAKIDDQVWNRQRQWEMKRDIVVEFVKVMKEFEQATIALGIAIKSKVAAAAQDKPSRQETVNRNLATWSPLSIKFEQYIYLATLVSSKKTIGTLFAVSKIVRDISSDVLSETNPNAYATRNVELLQQLNQLRDVLREDLGLPPILQSSESSVAPKSD